MNGQAEEVTSVSDIVKLVLSSLLVVASLIGFYAFSDVPLLYRVLALIVVVAASISIGFTTAKGKSVWFFFLEAKQEFKRIVWPTKDEAVRTTLLVVFMVFLVGFILWLLDMFLFWGVQLLMSQGIK